MALSSMYNKEDYFKGNKSEGEFLVPCLREQPFLWQTGTWPSRPLEDTLRSEVEKALTDVTVLTQWFVDHPTYLQDPCWLNARSMRCCAGGLLWQSITYDHPLAVIAFLLSLRHVDVNLSNPAMLGRTPLEMALNRGRWDVVQLLLQHPAIDVNITSNPQSYGDGSIVCRLHIIQGMN